LVYDCPVCNERDLTIMKALCSRLSWAYALAALLIGLVTTAALCADTPVTPAYLDTATYRGATVCKMCHNKKDAPTYTHWEASAHAKIAGSLPWKEGETPAAEVAYRHVTGYSAATKTWKDKGVTCEACHGPGSAHMMAKDKTATIIDPAALKTAGQQISVCGRCHGQYTIGGQKVALNYKFGQDLLATDGFTLAEVKAGAAMQEMNEVVASTHFAKGVTCVSCHSSHTATPQAHQLKKPVNELCLSCHQDQTMAAHAPKAAAGATCATCHLPKGSHAFAKPKAE